MNATYVMAAILAMAAVTFMLRAMPFVLPRKLMELPIAQRIATFMPLLIMVILVVHAFKDIDPVAPITTIALVGGIAVVAVLQYTLRQPLLSITAGVLVHIALLNS